MDEKCKKCQSVNEKKNVRNKKAIQEVKSDSMNVYSWHHPFSSRMICKGVIYYIIKKKWTRFKVAPLNFFSVTFHVIFNCRGISRSQTMWIMLWPLITNAFDQSAMSSHPLNVNNHRQWTLLPNPCLLIYHSHQLFRWSRDFGNRIVESSCVKSSQVESSWVKSNQVELRWVKSSWDESSRFEPSQLESS